MNNRKYTSTELGMMYGLLAGAAIGLVLFAITSNALWFIAIGAGLALGFGLGATWGRRA